MRSISLSQWTVGFLLASLPTLQTKKQEKCLPIGASCSDNEVCPACCDGEPRQLNGLIYCSTERNDQDVPKSIFGKKPLESSSRKSISADTIVAKVGTIPAQRNATAPTVEEPSSDTTPPPPKENIRVEQKSPKRLSCSSIFAIITGVLLTIAIIVGIFLQCRRQKQRAKSKNNLPNKKKCQSSAKYTAEMSALPGNRARDTPSSNIPIMSLRSTACQEYMNSTISSCPFGLQDEKVRVSSPQGTAQSHMPTEFNMTNGSKFSASQGSSIARQSSNSSTGSSVNVRFVNALSSLKERGNGPKLQVAV
uniref:AlNc14C143G7313 protein n=1 Tax=Albugo laibachii Nc14 TaxID=890382 RepID=F0WLC5_9STRA|nr:AlNc14C143G7313 [Albugo laibachii Nc14]|eukprot:CCA22088.1 AlNc14C143G7313 [Albugo laibachii Nc14]